MSEIQSKPSEVISTTIKLRIVRYQEEISFPPHSRLIGMKPILIRECGRCNLPLETHEGDQYLCSTKKMLSLAELFPSLHKDLVQQEVIDKVQMIPSFYQIVPVVGEVRGDGVAIFFAVKD